MASIAPLTFPLQLGDILRSVLRLPEEEGEPALIPVRAAELVARDEILAWPNGRVTRDAFPTAGGCVTVEINGTDVDIDPDEVVEVACLYGMLLPAAFVAGADVCWPDQRPSVLPEGRASGAGGAMKAMEARSVWLSSITHARATAPSAALAVRLMRARCGGVPESIGTDPWRGGG